MKRSVRSLIIAALVVGVVALVYLVWRSGSRESVEIRVGSRPVTVQIARTPGERQQGLSGRISLGENEGILFLFDSPSVYKFWMGGMLIPLDFIWIKDHRVVELTERVPAPNGGIPAQLAPAEEVDAVLEVNAGWASKYTVRVGDSVQY